MTSVHWDRHCRRAGCWSTLWDSHTQTSKHCSHDKLFSYTFQIRANVNVVSVCASKLDVLTKNGICFSIIRSVKKWGSKKSFKNGEREIRGKVCTGKAGPLPGTASAPVHWHWPLAP